MFTTFYDIVNYLKYPNYNTSKSLSVNNKITIVFHCLTIGLIIGFILAILIGIVSQSTGLDLGNHASSELFKKGPLMIFVLAVIVAPLGEELLFRAPLVLFIKYKNAFRYIFYAFAFGFGFIHILNYELSTTVLLLSPILVAPQICLGLILGFLRIKLGLIYSILLHMLYNAALIIPSLIFMSK